MTLDTVDATPARGAPTAAGDASGGGTETDGTPFRGFALGAALAAVVITIAPYVFGFALRGARPDLGWFSWLGYNFDDSCVYLSWMRQAADGSFFQRNLFTTAPQIGHQFNLFFLLLGNIARVTHLPLIFVYHAARVVLGIALLCAIWWLFGLLLEGRARRAAYLLVCFSAGFGWLPGLWPAVNSQQAPVDVWQPEAITFLSLYLNPLFLVSLLLMVGTIGWLYIADQRREYRPAVYAGLCALVLGNIHTYDVITVAAVGLAYMLLRIAYSVLRKQPGDPDTEYELRNTSSPSPPHALTPSFAAGEPWWEPWSRALLAALIALPSIAYTAWLLRTEETFARRAAVPTPSPPLALYLLGFGLVFVLALAGAWLLVRPTRNTQYASRLTPHASCLLIAWPIANLAAAYLPVSFQRKMVMGEHIALCALAGVALAWLLDKVPPVRPARTAALAATVALTSLTNVRFLLREAHGFQDNLTQSLNRPYLYGGEVQALEWLRGHTAPGTAVQPLPWVEMVPGTHKVAAADTTLAALTPGLTGRPVPTGHWGETPDYPSAIAHWVRFVLPNTPDAERKALLRQSGARYLVFSQKHVGQGDAAVLAAFTAAELPPYLRRVREGSNEDADVIEVDAGRLAD